MLRKNCQDKMHHMVIHIDTVHHSV